MCFNFKFFKNKKSPKVKKDYQYEKIQIQLLNLLNENRAIHSCLIKLHADMEMQLKELKDISISHAGASFMTNSCFDSPTIQRRDHSTMKIQYI